MKAIYLSALKQVTRRITTCQGAIKKPNTMVDCGWTDARYVASWSMKLHEAIYKLEKIKQRMSRGVS